jgi:predicted MFS family arabinose efflux permease
MEWRMVSPLVLATMASQALLVVLSPTIVAIANDLDTDVTTVGQARSVTALVSIAVSLAIIGRGARARVSRLIVTGTALTLVGCTAVATGQDVASFLLAHLVIGMAFALLLSGGFAGIAAFPAGRRAWATGYVTAALAGWPRS